MAAPPTDNPRPTRNWLAALPPARKLIVLAATAVALSGLVDLAISSAGEVSTSRTTTRSCGSTFEELREPTYPQLYVLEHELTKKPMAVGSVVVDVDARDCSATERIFEPRTAKSDVAASSDRATRIRERLETSRASLEAEALRQGVATEVTSQDVAEGVAPLPTGHELRTMTPPCRRLAEGHLERRLIPGAAVSAFLAVAWVAARPPARQRTLDR